MFHITTPTELFTLLFALTGLAVVSRQLINSIK